MISIELYSKRRLFTFLEQEYSAENAKKSFSGVGANEIISFFAEEDCDRWQVIDFEGAPEGITEYMALFSTRFFAKYFLALTLPKNGNIEAATAVHQKVEVSNLCKTSDPMFSMCLDEQMREGTVKFRLISPKYSYTEVWEQQNR